MTNSTVIDCHGNTRQITRAEDNLLEMSGRVCLWKHRRLLIKQGSLEGYTHHSVLGGLSGAVQCNAN